MTCVAEFISPSIPGKAIYVLLRTSICTFKLLQLYHCSLTGYMGYNKQRNLSSAAYWILIDIVDISYSQLPDPYLFESVQLRYISSLVTYLSIGKLSIDNTYGVKGSRNKVLSANTRGFTTLFLTPKTGLHRTLPTATQYFGRQSQQAWSLLLGAHYATPATWSKMPDIRDYRLEPVKTTSFRICALFSTPTEDQVLEHTTFFMLTIARTRSRTTSHPYSRPELLEQIIPTNACHWHLLKKKAIPWWPMLLHLIL